MQIVRVARPSGPAYGVLRGGHVVLIQGHPFAPFEVTDQIAPVEEVRLLAPVLPSKVLGIGKNYADHAAEMGGDVPTSPLVFLKPATTVIGDGDAIVLPSLSQEIHHEAELAVVIGRMTRRVAVEDAMQAVLGYTVANDVTARDLQRADGQWARAKGFDTFCPLGPVIETELDPAAGVAVRSRVNGVPRQEGTTTDLVFGVPELIAYCAAFTTLLPGDVILTGTPAGVGPISDGDTVEVEVEGIGTLTNVCRAED